MRHTIPMRLVMGSLLATSGSALGNMRAPRTRAKVPSFAAGPPAGSGELHTRVLHEDLIFRCQEKTCRVTASYLVESDRAAQVALDFILPENARVNGRLGTIPVPVSITSAANVAEEIERRLRLRQLYLAPDAWPMASTFRATASVTLQGGRNQVTFEYDQPLGARERDYGYFHEGRMVQHCFYVLWPLKEWSRAKDFAIDLRFEVDRKPPSWWKRTFGHPTNVSCRDFSGQRAQVGGQLVYRASIGDPFPDYLDCEIGDDDLVEESAR